MMDKLSVLLTALCLPSLNGKALESIPSISVLKKPEEAISLSCRGTGFDFSLNFLTVCYKDLISCCQLQQKKRSSHQITFNSNHVLCSSAAAAGCWILCEV
ncbi:hypothetical protein PFLUV_G00175210 [Perca fluviatilis]|uniref:Immunoglobulin V-set domain-containing protein n=1 Tax=Perca fluviatilis TaxID=8168 RepID=A0A6A5EKA9_PERFL|nr:hypothetical protein PFLUV_G00175210 [Perca fluviatilis]